MSENKPAETPQSVAPTGFLQMFAGLGDPQAGAAETPEATVTDVERLDKTRIALEHVRDQVKGGAENLEARNFMTLVMAQLKQDYAELPAGKAKPATFGEYLNIFNQRISIDTFVGKLIEKDPKLMAVEDFIAQKENLSGLPPITAKDGETGTGFLDKMKNFVKKLTDGPAAQKAGIDYGWACGAIGVWFLNWAKEGMKDKEKPALMSGLYLKIACAFKPDMPECKGKKPEEAKKEEEKTDEEKEKEKKEIVEANKNLKKNLEDSKYPHKINISESSIRELAKTVPVKDQAELAKKAVAADGPLKKIADNEKIKKYLDKENPELPLAAILLAQDSVKKENMDSILKALEQKAEKKPAEFVEFLTKEVIPKREDKSKLDALAESSPDQTANT